MVKATAAAIMMMVATRQKNERLAKRNAPAPRSLPKYPRGRWYDKYLDCQLANFRCWPNAPFVAAQQDGRNWGDADAASVDGKISLRDGALMNSMAERRGKDCARARLTHDIRHCIRHHLRHHIPHVHLTCDAGGNGWRVTTPIT